MLEIVNCFKGEGSFNFVSSETFVVDLGFKLIQYSNAKIEIECFLIESINNPFHVIANVINSTQKDEILVHMDGKVHESTEGKIKVEEAYITTINLDFDKNNGLRFKLILESFNPVEIIFEDIPSKNDVKLCAGLTNFVFGKCSSSDKLLDGFKSVIEDYTVYLHQNENYDACVKALKDNENPKTILLTSEAVIKYTYGKNGDFTGILTKLSDLLSYACRTRITHIYENYYYENDLFKIILRPVLTRKFNKGKNLIDSNHFEECNLKYYLERCYPLYSEYVNKFALNIILSFYLEAFYTKYMDMEFLLNTTALETLLSGYEELREEEGNPIVKGLIKKNKNKIMKIFNDEGFDSEEIAEKISNEVSYANLNVQEKLSAFVKDDRFSVKLNKYDRDFSIIRNKIAHTGKFPKMINYGGKERKIDARTECDRLIYLLDRVILTMLNYKEKPFYNKMDGSVTGL